jgi:NAD(P)-dependent dehydrogenase (short-subunit alcohol dehydrogenase family)
MNFGLKGKTAVVTGSTAGIGLAIATALAEEGAKVVINGRTEARVSAALAKIRHKDHTADLLGVAADLGSAAGVETFVKQVPHADILINNLGIFEPKPFAEIPDSDWIRFFEVNVMSGVRLSRHYLPGMLRNNWGRIIFISSESAFQVPAEMVSLRHDQDRASRRGSRSRRIRGGHRRNRELRPSRPHGFRRRGEFSRQLGQETRPFSCRDGEGIF